MDIIKFPDAEKAWIHYLTAKTGEKVGTRVPKQPRFIRLMRAGGNRSVKVLDSAQMIFECYDTDDELAAEFASDTRALVHAGEGQEIAPGVFCYRQRDVSGPSYINDEQHPSSRYSFTVMTDLRGQSVPG